MLAACAAMLALASCTTSAEPANPSVPATSEPTTNVENHESGPESLIAFGVSVPPGAVQVGPTIKSRSAALLETYRPELEVAEAEAAAAELAEQAEEGAEASPSPSPSPTETTNTRPERDTFELLEDPPRPDSAVSLIRIDGDATSVVRRLLAQLDALLPGAGIVTDDLSTYCEQENRRITGCELKARGAAPSGREYAVELTVDPGDITTRTANAASLRKPVIRLELAYIGDPRLGQQSRENEDLSEAVDIDEQPEKSGLIWPMMDEDRSITEPIVRKWTVPDAKELLLSGRQPEFSVLTSKQSSVASQVAQEFVESLAPGRPIERDVIADLNEVHTVYTATRPQGLIVRAVHVVSARGNYVYVTTKPPASQS